MVMPFFFTLLTFQYHSVRMTTPTFSDTLPLAFCGFFSSNSQTESLASSFTSGQPLHGCTSQDLVLSPLLSPTLIFLERSHTTPCSKEHQYGTATQVLSRPDRSSRLQATHSDICTQIDPRHKRKPDVLLLRFLVGVSHVDCSSKVGIWYL